MLLVNTMYRPGGLSDDDDFDDDYAYDFDDPIKKTPTKPAPRPMPQIHSEKLRNQITELWEKDRTFAELQTAVDKDDFDTLESLVRQGVAVDGPDQGKSWTPLMTACSKGQSEMVSYLLSNGASAAKHIELATPLMACCPMVYSSEDKLLECVQLLLNHGADANAKDRFKMTALMYAAKYGHAQIVNRLLVCPNIELDAVDKEGWTALFYAVDSQQPEIVEILLAVGCNVMFKELRSNYTALDLALQKNYVEIAQILGYTAPVELPVCAVVKDPMTEFLSQLPNDQGNGGFTKDVESILLGLGLQPLFKKLTPVPSLPDFLNITDDDLKNVGIKLSPLRRKILVDGIHRYHLHPWKSTSMHQVTPNVPFCLEDAIHTMANMVKHLAILVASLRYLRRRLLERIQLGIAASPAGLDLVSVLVDTQVEVSQLQLKLKRLHAAIKRMKKSGDFPADFIGPEHWQPAKRPWISYLWSAVAAAGISWVIYYCR